MKSKKRSINLNIKMSNRWLYTIVALVLLLVLGFGVWAYQTNNPQNFGHTLGEITGITCPSGQVLQYTTSGWGCGSVSGGGSLSCVTVTGSPASGALSKATCGSGYTMTGGGCLVSGGSGATWDYKYHPSTTEQAFECQLQGTGFTITAYARCCKII